MADPAKLDPDIALLLQELKAARLRMTQATKSWKGRASALRAYALCNEINRLCQAAALSSDPAMVKTLLGTSRSHLDELQKLLPLQ